MGNKVHSSSFKIRHELQTQTFDNASAKLSLLNTPFINNWFTRDKKLIPIFVNEDEHIRQIIEEHYFAFPFSGYRLTRHNNGEQLQIVFFSIKPAALVGKQGRVVIGIKNKIARISYSKYIDLHVEEYENVTARSISGILLNALSQRSPLKKVFYFIKSTAQRHPQYLGHRIELKGRLNGAEKTRTVKIKYGATGVHGLKNIVDSYDIAYNGRGSTNFKGTIGIKIVLCLKRIVEKKEGEKTINVVKS